MRTFRSDSPPNNLFQEKTTCWLLVRQAVLDSRGNIRSILILYWRSILLPREKEMAFIVSNIIRGASG